MLSHLKEEKETTLMVKNEKEKEIENAYRTNNKQKKIAEKILKNAIIIQNHLQEYG